ncbi:hypothetical protein C8R44DRAFT_794400 [Mycena epipterygia]|nr:hypothetical protein C8R44DRAFT_794400 [Mycena epipterygia]
MILMRLAASIFHWLFFSAMVLKSSNWPQYDIALVTTITTLVRLWSTKPEMTSLCIDCPMGEVKWWGSLWASGVIESHDATKRITLGYVPWRT